MGICPSADGQSECGSKTCGILVNQPMNIERVLGGRAFFKFVFHHSSNV